MNHRGLTRACLVSLFLNMPVVLKMAKWSLSCDRPRGKSYMLPDGEVSHCSKSRTIRRGLRNVRYD